eukprot:3034007-Rhodomonas_salina.3
MVGSVFASQPSLRLSSCWVGELSATLIFGAMSLSARSCFQSGARPLKTVGALRSCARLCHARNRCLRIQVCWRGPSGRPWSLQAHRDRQTDRQTDKDRQTDLTTELPTDLPMILCYVLCRLTVRGG